MCRHQDQKVRFCEHCVLELHAEQSMMVSQLQNRFEDIWDAHHEMHEELIRIEDKYPITRFEILYSAPFSLGLKEVVGRILKKFKELSTLREVQIGSNNDGLFIFTIRGRHGNTN